MSLRTAVQPYDHIPVVGNIGGNVVEVEIEVDVRDNFVTVSPNMAVEW